MLDREDQFVPFQTGQGNSLGGDQTLYDRLDDAGELLGRDLRDGGQIQAVDELAVDRAFQLLIGAHSGGQGASPQCRIAEQRRGDLAVLLGGKPVTDRHLTLLSRGNSLSRKPFLLSSPVDVCVSPSPANRSASCRKLLVTSFSGPISRSSFPRLIEEMTVG